MNIILDAKPTIRMHTEERIAAFEVGKKLTRKTNYIKFRTRTHCVSNKL